VLLGLWSLGSDQASVVGSVGEQFTSHSETGTSPTRFRTKAIVNIQNSQRSLCLSIPYGRLHALPGKKHIFADLWWAFSASGARHQDICGRWQRGWFLMALIGRFPTSFQNSPLEVLRSNGASHEQTVLGPDSGSALVPS
jgi:hypothetical protein